MKHLYLLILIVLCGASLRFYGLGSESLWMDEGFAFAESNTETIGQTISKVAQPPEGTPPLYFMLLHYWMKFAGTQEPSIRFLSAFFSTLAIIMIFFLGREIANPEVGLYSAALLSFSMIHIVYAQEARPYGLFTFLIITSLFFFIKLQKTGRFAYHYIISTILMLYTHYLSVFILLLQNIIVVFTKQNLKQRRWLPLQFTLAVLYIPGLWILSRQFGGLNETVKISLSQKLGFPEFIVSLGVYNFIVPAAVALLALLLIRKKIDLRKLWLPDSIFVPIALGLMAIAFLMFQDLTKSTFITRYTHFSFPLLYLILARQFDRLKGKKLLAIMFLILAATSITYYHLDDRKIDWKGGVAFIESKNFSGDQIIVINEVEHGLFLYYYQGPGRTIPVTLYPDQRSNLIEREQLKERLEGIDKVWFVYPKEYKSKGIYHEYLFTAYFLNDSRSYKGLDIYHLVR